MRKWSSYALFPLLLLVLGIGSGIGAAGIIDVEGTFQVRIVPQPVALIKAGPEGGPYSLGPFVGAEPFKIEYVACCVQDPTGGTVSYEWDFDYDGVTFTSDASGPGPVSHTYPDGPTDTLVAVRLTSSTGVETIISEQAMIHNLPPTADAGAPYAGTVGQPVTFSGLARDASAEDMVAGFTYEWDFEYENATFTVDQRGHDLATPSHTYNNDGTYAVALRVVDKDGGVSGISTTTVAVGGVTKVTLDALADTWINQAADKENYGDLATMHIQTKEAQDRRALVRFDLSGIPSDATILSAELRASALSVPSGTRAYGAHRIEAGWDEASVTWDSRPEFSSGYTDTATTPATAGWMAWNVTSGVQAMVEGTVDNFGWMTKDTDEDGATAYRTVFSTREDPDSSVRPVLVIIYE